jgi:signal transduction histidine kinase/PAS domain-containing protein
MKYIMNKGLPKAIFHTKNGILVEANEQFESLTGFLKEELIGKSIEEVSIILKTELENIHESNNSFYLFTKDLEPREVTISCEKIEDKNENIFFIKEKYNSRLENIFPFINSYFYDEEQGIAIYSVPDLLVLKMNKTFLSINSIPYDNIEEFIGQRLENIIPDYYGSQSEESYKETINSGRIYHLKEYKLTRPPNLELYEDSSLVPVFIKGKIKYLIQIAKDVTERVKSRELIEKQNKELEAIIDNINEDLLIFDSSGNILKMNNMARNNHKINYKAANNADNFYKQADLYDINGNQIDYKDRPINRVIRGEIIHNLQVVFKQNNEIDYREVSGTPIYDQEGNFIAGIALSNDINERINYEKNLYITAQNETMTKIVNNLDLGFARYSYPEFKLISINNKGLDLLSKIVPDMDPLTYNNNNIFDSFYDGLFIIDDNIKKYLKINKESCVKTSRYFVEKEYLFIKWIYQPLFDLNNEIIEVIIIGIDVTKEEMNIKKMEKVLKIQDEIYANVSHELKTPLNVIFSANQMMNIYLNHDKIEEYKDKLFNYNNIVNKNCYRLIKIINNIVDLSKSKSGMLTLDLCNVNIVSVIRNIVLSVSDYVESRELKIIFNSNVDEKIIACDLHKIDRVMLNLISNAIKFSYNNGEINVNVMDKGDTVEISVKDNGTGIDKVHMDLIFQRFYQADKSLSRNAEGSGIGLAIVKSIIDLHNGIISVESELEKGSTFKFELPFNTIQESNPIEQIGQAANKVELIKIEFSDIF